MATVQTLNKIRQTLEKHLGKKIVLKANKGVYYLRTNKGERCLKKINYGPQKLLFVYGAKEHLIKNGFNMVDRYFLNIEGEPYALVNEVLYTLSEWLEGRECDFHNVEEVKLAAKTLATMHEASKGYDPPENSKLKSDLGRWPHLMEKRIKSLDKMRDMIRKKNNKSEFDLLYLKSMEFYKEMGKKAFDTLQGSAYYDLCSVTEKEKSFCHHDFTYHIIILDDNNDVHVIDFDFCKRKFVDVQVIFHKMEQRTLTAAYKFYCGRNLEDAHTAEADTRATYEVLMAQLDRYPEELQNDMSFLADYSSYNKNVDFAGRMVYDDNGVEVFNFGKYKGQSVSEVLKKDPGYYSWILNSDFTLNTKAMLTKIRLRELTGK